MPSWFIASDGVRVAGETSKRTAGRIRTSLLDWASIVLFVGGGLNCGLAGLYELYFGYRLYGARTGEPTRERKRATQ